MAVISSHLFKEGFENVNNSCLGTKPAICWSLQIKNQQLNSSRIE